MGTTPPACLRLHAKWFGAGVFFISGCKRCRWWSFPAGGGAPGAKPADNAALLLSPFMMTNAGSFSAGQHTVGPFSASDWTFAGWPEVDLLKKCFVLSYTGGIRT